MKLVLLLVLFGIFLIPIQTVLGQEISTPPEIIIESFTFAPVSESNDDVNEYYFQILLVILPIIGAFLTTKFVAQTWQERREKYELQEKILLKVDEAYTDYYLDVWNLIYEIGIAYFDESTYKSYQDENGVEKIKFAPLTTFPSAEYKKEEQPSFLFATEFDKIYYDDNAISFKNIEKLWTIILCYYGDDKMEFDKITKEITTKSDAYFMTFRKYFYAINGGEFEKNFYDLYDISTEIVDLTRQLKTKLLQTAMKKRKL